MAHRHAEPWPFMKMHGLGNDFVVVDARPRSPNLTESLVRALGDRHRGIGFDQLAAIHGVEGGEGSDAESSETGPVDATLEFYNSDGSSSSACGNATRCVARYLLDLGEGRDGVVRLRTGRGVLEARDVGNGEVTVNMGAPLMGWRDIPLAREMDTLELPIDGAPTATGMGNPHCTFFVEDPDGVDLAEFGPPHERHELFPERTNVQVAKVAEPGRIRLRVWERGVGITLASGSSACAATVAAARRGLTGRRAKVELDGGLLDIDWREDGVWMSGPCARVFDGELAPGFLEGLA